MLTIRDTLVNLLPSLHVVAARSHFISHYFLNTSKVSDVFTYIPTSRMLSASPKSLANLTSLQFSLSLHKEVPLHMQQTIIHPGCNIY